MGRRLLVLAFAMVLFSGCAAFDTDNTPYTGFSPDLIPALPNMAGPLTGHYVGTMTLDSSTCEAVSDEVGKGVALVADVVQGADGINLKKGAATLAAVLNAQKKATFMEIVSETMHVVYALDFSTENTIKGTSEVIEADENGQFAAPCASYTVVLERSDATAAE